MTKLQQRGRRFSSTGGGCRSWKKWLGAVALTAWLMTLGTPRERAAPWDRPPVARAQGEAADEGSMVGAGRPPVAGGVDRSLVRQMALLQARGVLGSDSGGSEGSSAVGRGELAQWLVRALLGPSSRDLPPADALAVAAAWGWVPSRWREGTATHGSEQPVTRLDLAWIAAALLGPGRGHWPREMPWPPDLAQLSPSDQAVARAALANGLVTVRDGLLWPQRPATREETILWCARLLELTGHLFDAEGELVAVHGRDLRLRIGGRLLSAWLAPTARIFRNGEAAQPARLEVDDEVRIIWARDEGGGRRGDGSPVVALADAYAIAVDGVVVAADWSSRRLALRGTDAAPVHGQAAAAPTDSLQTYSVEADAPVLLNGKPSSLAALRPGDRVTVWLRRVGSAVRRIGAVRVDAEGVVVDVDPVHGWMRLATGAPAAGSGRETETWVLADGAVVVRHGRPITLDEVKPGATVAVSARVSGVAVYVEVAGATQEGQVPRR